MQIEKGQVWSSIQGGKVKVQEVTKSTVTFYWLAGEPYLSYRLIGEFLESFERVDDSKRLRKKSKKHSHYFKDVSEYQEIDVYALCKIFEIDDPTGCTHHAIKKLLAAGKRGHKDRLTDLQNVIDTVQRLIELEGYHADNKR